MIPPSNIDSAASDRQLPPQPPFGKSDDCFHATSESESCSVYISSPCPHVSNIDVDLSIRILLQFSFLLAQEKNSIPLSLYSTAMVSSQLYSLINMEKSPAKIKQPSSLFFDVLYSHILTWVYVLKDFFSMYWFGFSAWDEKSSHSFELPKEKTTASDLCREDVEKLMGELGLFCNQQNVELQDIFSSDDFSRLFEDMEPSLEEIKQAFDVFDLNRDGFVDAGDLQRVLRILGLKEGFEVESCIKMIESADENRDGKIDFKEFVKFMEKSVC